MNPNNIVDFIEDGTIILSLEKSIEFSEKQEQDVEYIKMQGLPRWKKKVMRNILIYGGYQTKISKRVKNDIAILTQIENTTDNDIKRATVQNAKRLIMELESIRKRTLKTLASTKINKE